MAEPTLEKFLKDVENHEINIIHSDGFYRHIRFKKPDCSSYYFDLVTGHGFLMIRGDMGCYVFERIPDMFGFFRNNRATKETDLEINVGYWAEKVVSQSIFGNGIKKFDLDKFKEAVENDLNNYIECDSFYSMDLPESLIREAVKDDILDCADDEYNALEAIRNFSFNGDTATRYLPIFLSMTLKAIPFTLFGVFTRLFGEYLSLTNKMKKQVSIKLNRYRTNDVKNLLRAFYGIRENRHSIARLCFKTIWSR